jgi:NAD-dependent dihydropyrimidine dehydrogenase PreA subunit
MAAIFIDIVVDPKFANDGEIARRLEEVCPVGIFDASGATLRIVEENLDECVLCDLCLEAAPEGGVQIRKLYE